MMGYALKINQTAHPIVFGPVILSSDHISAATGKTLVVTISKDGGAFGSPAGAVTEIANGYYQIAGNATDANALGPLKVNVAAGATWDPFNEDFIIVSYDPFDSVRMGLTALPNAAANAAGGLPVSTAGALDMDDLAADTDAIETRVTLALPAVAPNAAGGLLITAAGSLDMDDLAADVDVIETRVTLALPAAASNAPGGLPISAAGGLALDTVLSGNTPQTGDSFPFANRTVCRGTVGATSPTTTSFTPSALLPAGVTVDQFKGRIIIFDNATTTTALRGQATEVKSSSAAALPLLTFTALTNAPVSGDTFSIV